MTFLTRCARCEFHTAPFFGENLLLRRVQKLARNHSSCAAFAYIPISRDSEYLGQQEIPLFDAAEALHKTVTKVMTYRYLYKGLTFLPDLIRVPWLR